MKYESVIGLEVHAHLLTESKIFCGCSTEFGRAPNENTCPVCAGFPESCRCSTKKSSISRSRPGWRPIAKSLDRAFSRVRTISIRICRKAIKSVNTSCRCAPMVTSKSISMVLAKECDLTRIHMEEDAGKNIHDAHGDASLVDLNRAGVPLLEIVSEPDLRAAEEAGAYLRTLRTILQYLGVCDGNMEEGSFRCDANVSVRPEGSDTLGTKIEIKNLNSFKAIENAINFEIERQVDTLSTGGKLFQETRLWDENREETRSMRSKESAHDYRYFPDPDLLPLVIDEEWIAEVRATLPELPGTRKQRFKTDFALPAYDAELLTSRKDIADYFEAAVKIHANPKALSNWIVGDLFRVLKERKLDEQLYIATWPIRAERLAELVALIDSGKINGKIAKTVFEASLDSDKSPRQIVSERGLEQVSDEGSIEIAIDQILAANSKQVEQFQSGNEKVFGFLVGQIMKATQGKANPQKVNEILREKLKNAG